VDTLEAKNQVKEHYKVDTMEKVKVTTVQDFENFIDKHKLNIPLGFKPRKATTDEELNNMAKELNLDTPPFDRKGARHALFTLSTKEAIGDLVAEAQKNIDLRNIIVCSTIALLSNAFYIEDLEEICLGMFDGTFGVSKNSFMFLIFGVLSIKRKLKACATTLQCKPMIYTLCPVESVEW
jgi:hypothetical protein